MTEDEVMPVESTTSETSVKEEVLVVPTAPVLSENSSNTEQSSSSVVDVSEQPKRKSRKVIETSTSSNKRNSNGRHSGVIRKKRQNGSNKDSYVTAELTERYEKLLNDPNAPRLNINDLTDLNIQELKEKAEQTGVSAENIASMKKQDIIFNILKTHVENN